MANTNLNEPDSISFCFGFFWLLLSLCIVCGIRDYFNITDRIWLMIIFVGLQVLLLLFCAIVYKCKEMLTNSYNISSLSEQNLKDSKHEYKITNYVTNEINDIIYKNGLKDKKDIYAAKLVATNKINHSPKTISNIYNISLDKAKEIEESITVTEEKRIANHIAYEGRIKTSDKNKLKAILGYKCSACGTDMSKIYGDIGQHYIELHHKIPYSNIRENETRTLTEQEFCVLCPNCHRMIHKLPDASDIDLLSRIIKLNKEN